MLYNVMVSDTAGMLALPVRMQGGDFQISSGRWWPWALADLADIILSVNAVPVYGDKLRGE